ncbi:MAG: hypothetical protein WA055_04670 [Candidatus Moraniibacteriota bacterium]
MSPKLTHDELVSSLTKRISILSKNKAIFIVGITGIDASGKSKLSENISEKLINDGKNVLTVSGDSFQFPREYKENFIEKTWAIQHVKRTINFQSMTDKFLAPISQKPESIILDAINYDSGEKISKIVPLKYPLIVVVESIYLFQEPMLKYLDYKIFLEIDQATALLRAKTRPRDLLLYGDEDGIEKKYTKKNFSGYLFFDKIVQPKQYADVIINNNDWENPEIVSGLI